MKKRVLSLCIALILLCSGIPTNTFGQESVTGEATQQETGSVSGDTSNDLSVEKGNQITTAAVANPAVVALQSQIESAASGVETTITLTSNTELNYFLNVPANKKIVFNLAGYTLSSTSVQGIFKIAEGGNLTVIGNGTILSNVASGVAVTNNGTFQLNGGTILASGSGGIGILYPNTAIPKTTITAGTITGDSLAIAKGTTVSNTSGTYTIPAGSFLNSASAAPVKYIKVSVMGNPTGLTATVNSYNSVKLSWAAVSGATSYRIYRSTSATSGFKIVTGATSLTTNTFTDKNLTSGTKYYYKVYSILGNILKSSSVVSAKPVPVAATLKVVSVNYYQMNISWSKIDGATKYLVYRSVSATSGFKKVATLSSGSLVYKDKAVSNGTTYYYKVVAYAGSVRGKSSKATGALSKIINPGSVSGNCTAYNSVKLTWSKVSGAEQYVVYRATTANGTYKKIKTLSQSKLTYTNTGRTCGTTYYYKVAAVKAGVTGTFSKVVAVTPVPNQVTALTAKSTGITRTTLTWSGGEGASSYMIFRSTNVKMGYSKIATSTGKSYVDNGISDGKTYYYIVRPMIGILRGSDSSIKAFTNATAVAMNKSTASVDVGSYVKLKVSYAPSTTTTKSTTTLTWKSSDTSVAKVTKYGNVRGVSEGTATITATTPNGKVTTCKIKVDKNIVVVLDPGHGGYDSGAYYNGTKESTLNLKVSTYTKAALEKYSGITVKMTRTTDVFIPLAERTEIAQDYGCDFFISQHFNASGNHTATGTGAFISLTDAYNSTTKAMANKIVSQAQTDLGISRWGVYTRASSDYPGQDYYSVIRGSVAKGFPGIIVENAFLDSSDFSNYLNTDAKLKAIAESNAKAIASYYGLSKK